MHKIEHFKTGHRQGKYPLSMRNAALMIALGIASSLSAPTLHAQSTSSSVFGHAPSGEVVTAISAMGLHRHSTANKHGRYKIDPLPMGDYTVTLEKDGKTIDTRHSITLLVGQNAEVDFACPNDHCEASEN